MVNLSRRQILKGVVGTAGLATAWPSVELFLPTQREIDLIRKEGPDILVANPLPEVPRGRQGILMPGTDLFARDQDGMFQLVGMVTHLSINADKLETTMRGDENPSYIYGIRELVGTFVGRM